jgi:preprotein translocase subunit SecD
MKIVGTALALLLLALSAGCTPPASMDSPTVPRKAASSAGAPASVATSATDVAPLIFADPVGIDLTPSKRPAVGSRPATSSYEPFLDARHVTSVSWAWAQTTGQSQPGTLTVDLDKAGTATLEKWTSTHIGREMLVLGNGRVISLAPVRRPVTRASIDLFIDDARPVRDLLNSK